ncbi:MAG TPA: hypothetical protein VJT49_32970 [Amycolatopsis sp.]|uniref:hypothetical protein n=1 Tax=Amycolatopsis sp. TaxID=37632 RepID=UPI002B4A8F5F|nr:hypothetical protein [Amycolatopsis sp.]HKS49837.1 hypothetical protein [Amycolatopsis sp.]
MGHPSPRVELLFDHDVSVEPATDLEATFRQLGFVTSTRRRLPHRGPNELTWLMLASLPLQAFLSGIGAEAVKDLYAKAKRLTRSSRKTAKDGGNQVPLVLHDTATGLEIILEPGLPAEAIRQLIGLDLRAYRTGPLHYDQHQKKWRSELDEAGAEPDS